MLRTAWFTVFCEGCLGQGIRLRERCVLLREEEDD
jgi:hypothetical protein